MLKKINKIEADLIQLDVLVNGFAGESTKTRGIIPVELKVGNLPSLLFILRQLIMLC